MGNFVLGILKQAQANAGSVAFSSFAFVKEIRLEKRDPELERFMLGPIFMLALSDFEMRLPVMTFWKRLSEKMEVVA